MPEVAEPEVKEEVKAVEPVEHEAGTPEAEAEALADLQAIIDAQKDGTAPKQDADEEDEKDKDDLAEVEEPDEAKEPKTKAAAPETPSAGIPLKLALRASKVMDESEILDYEDDAKSLERTVAALERRAKDSSTQKPAANAEDSKADEELSDLSEDDTAEPIVKWGKRVVDQLKKLVAENKAVREAHDNLLNVYTYNREGERFDRAVSKLGQADLFGDGDIESLEEGSEQYKNRLELFKAKQEVQAQYRARHEKMPTEAKLVERAYRLAFAQKIEQKQKQTLTEKLKSQKLSVAPTRRKSASGETATDKLLAEMDQIISKKK